MMGKIFVFLAGCLILAGCTKVDNTYKAELRVVTTTGIPIQNCAVKLFVPVQESLVFYDFTDENGIVKFEIKNKAFYDVKIWKGTWRGCGYVEFMKGETVTKDIFIRTWGDPLNTCWY